MSEITRKRGVAEDALKSDSLGTACAGTCVWELKPVSNTIALLMLCLILREGG